MLLTDRRGGRRQGAEGEEPTHEEMLDMKFGKFVLKAGEASVGERQLLDVPQDMTIRFADVAEQDGERTIEVTYSQTSASKAEPKATAFIVIDTADPRGASHFEDVNGSRGRPDRGPSEEYEKAPKVHRVASAGGLLVFEAI